MNYLQHNRNGALTISERLLVSHERPDQLAASEWVMSKWIMATNERRLMRNGLMSNGFQDKTQFINSWRTYGKLTCGKWLNGTCEQVNYGKLPKPASTVLSNHLAPMNWQSDSHKAALLCNRLTGSSTSFGEVESGTVSAAIRHANASHDRRNGSHHRLFGELVQCIKWTLLVYASSTTTWQTATSKLPVRHRYTL